MRSLIDPSAPRGVPAASRRGANSRGFVVIVVLVVLVVLSVILAAIVKLSFLSQKQLRVEERLMQADWLCDSGLERALAQLKVNPEYAGETWLVPAEDLDGQESAKVVITVVSEDSESLQRRLDVRVEYPPDSLQRIVRTCEDWVVSASNAPRVTPDDASDLPEDRR